MSFVVQHSYLIPLLPLLAAIVCGLFGARVLRGGSHWPVWLGVGASAVLSFVLLIGMLSQARHNYVGSALDSEVTEAALETTPRLTSLGQSSHWFTWLHLDWPIMGDAAAGKISSLNIAAGAWIDPLTVVMLGVVCGIGFLITIFSAGYMKGESGYWRFFAYLGLFIFFMTCLVMGENLIMLYLGWEGVGLCSYLLIGFYYDKPAAREAAKKAFLVNRVGDLGFALGIMLAYAAFGTVSFFGDPNIPNDGLLELATGGSLTAFQSTATLWLPFLLMLGAFGKSAQFPLYVWLPDAMEGPTPVSALIHAATMVTAGVYMIARCGSLFVGNQAAMITIAAIGGFTALFAATIALRQYDLKKVFAYSTVSQLGFMFAAVGVLAPVAGVFHLITHAFFKALLFLSSGVVMHAMLGHLDMRQMSGLKHKLPITRICCLIGCASLAGFPLITSGFWSKDSIIHAAHESSWILYAVLLLTAFLTAYYTFRLYFRVFEGPLLTPAIAADGHVHNDDDHAPASATKVDDSEAAHLAHDDSHGKADHAGHGDEHDHGESLLMIVPLVILAAGAIFSMLVNLPGTHWLANFLGQSESFKLAYEAAGARYGFPLRQAAELGQGTEHHGVPWLSLTIGGLVSLAGIAMAAYFHLLHRDAGDALPLKFRGLSRLFESKYHVDEIYQGLIVNSLRRLARSLSTIDKWIIDGVFNLLSAAPQVAGYSMKFTVQRGYLQGYALAMLAGVAILLLVVFL